MSTTCLPTAGFHRGTAPADLTGASEAAARSVIGRFGLVRACEELAWREGLPRVHIAVAQGPRRLPGWLAGASLDGTGVSPDPQEARLAAVAEAVERYASTSTVSEESLGRARFIDLGGDAVDPMDFALLSAAQYRLLPGLEPLRRDKQIDWCRAFSLSRGETSLVPAALAHLALARRPPNDFLPETTTTGVACHVSLPHALLGGLCEVFERDALMVAWANRLPHTRLDPIGTPVEELLDTSFAGCDARFLLFQVPTDIPFPVILALAESAGHPPHAAVGAACRPDAVSAARRALLEASQVLSRLVSRPPPRPERIRSFADHAALYAFPREAALLRAVLGDGGQRGLSDVPAVPGRWVEARLDHGLAWLGTVGLEAHVVELTTPDIAPTGYRVLRLLVPGMVDHNADARVPRLGGRRLSEMPVRLGFRDRPLGESHLNRLPLPLA